MEAFFTSTVLVALAEIGDNTQLLSLVLAAKLRQPYPIMGGILAATLLNHALAAWAGAWLGLDLCRAGVLVTTLIAFFLAEMGDTKRSLQRWH